MASSFTGSNPQVDVIPSAPSTQITHDDLHDDKRNAIAATQQWIRAYVLPILANGWVTAARIATGAVTDSKIASVNVQKLTGSNGTLEMPGHVYTTGHITCDGVMRAITGVRAGPGTVSAPTVLCTWVRGQTNGSGAVTLPHQVSALHRKILDSKVYFRGAGAEARDLLPTGCVYDGTNVVITGGPANTRVRVGIWYMADVDADWPA